MVYQHMTLARQPSYSTLIQSLCISTSQNQTQSCSTRSTIFETSLSEIQLPFSEFPVSLTLNFMLRACTLLWIPKSRLLWVTDCEHFHLAIPKQYHQRWIFFFHFAILYMQEVIEDIPFSNLTRIHCTRHLLFQQHKSVRLKFPCGGITTFGFMVSVWQSKRQISCRVGNGFYR